MRGKSGEIQLAILELLENHHRLHTEEIVPKVVKKVRCSSKPVYDNLRSLAKIGEIGLDVFENGRKEYYDLDIKMKSKDVIKSHRTSLNAIAKVNDDIKKIFKTLDQTRQAKFLDIHLRMQEVLYAGYKCMETYPVFRKNKEFVKMKKEFDQAFTDTIRLLDEIPDDKQADEVFLQMNNDRVYQHIQLQKEFEKFIANLPDEEKRMLG